MRPLIKRIGEGERYDAALFGYKADKRPVFNSLGEAYVECGNRWRLFLSFSPWDGRVFRVNFEVIILAPIK
tara:strand:+ start:92 stop:304 length:213 start_codon:yes stop_codon:yes gene_type:complete